MGQINASEHHGAREGIQYGQTHTTSARLELDCEPARDLYCTNGTLTYEKYMMLR